MTAAEQRRVIAAFGAPILMVGVTPTLSITPDYRAAIGWGYYQVPEAFAVEFPTPHFSSRFGIVQHYTSSAEFVSTGD